MSVIKAIFPFLVFSSAFVGGALAASEVPKDYIGDWVARDKPCNAHTRFVVMKDRVMLTSGDNAATFRDPDVCYSCWGGAQYSGIVVMLMPKDASGNSPFQAMFNANEKPGETVIDMPKGSPLALRFPLGGVVLRKCSGQY